MAAFGHPRYTGDIDFWVSRSPANVERLLTVLRDFGFESLGLGLDDFAADSVIQLGHPPRRIDLSTTLDGVDFDACDARREEVVVGDTRLSMIGLADFKANKLATGRAKDLADLESLDAAPGSTTSPGTPAPWSVPRYATRSHD